jgi:2-polyprenyl-3-methyl-5-hydroxy-6-metoxy-1,4-benzoquinol methylase
MSPLREDAYGTRKRVEFASALIAALRPKRVLDFGCGSGAQLTFPLAQIFPQVEFLGVDSDAPSIAHAAAECRAPNLRFAPAAALQGDERFDLVIASEVIEHVQSPLGLLRSLAARLDPGGRMLLTLPNGYGPFELAELSRDLLELAGILPVARSIKRALLRQGPPATRDTYAVSPHVNFFSLAEIRAAIAAAGLREVEFRPRTLLCGFGFDLVVRGETLTGWNAAAAERLPASLASDWMFVLEPSTGAKAGGGYRRGRYALLRRRLGDVVAALSPAERRQMLAHRAARSARLAWWRIRDAHAATFASATRAPLARGLFAPRAVSSPEMIRDLGVNYLAHRFDVLGSGWTEVRRTVEAGINAANLDESRRIRRMVSSGYRPIDWQIDFKSGFRWSEATPAQDIVFGDVRGVDVKVPWELARLQHLVPLAHAFSLDRDERYAREFRDQALDFIACNPPRFGVNWASSMDVAIRAANLLVARDFFLAAGASFDADFEALLARSIGEHAEFVAAMLDWHPRYRGNHYLCGVAGLLFAATYLGDERRRRHAIGELQAETRRQFLPDGGSFEASTGYHRLSGEAVLYASMLATNELPPEHFERIAAIACFTAETARPDGTAPQIGDQDSGRFLKIDMRCRKGADGEWHEDFLDHGSLAAAVAVREQPPELVRVPGDPDALLARLRVLPADRKATYRFDFGEPRRASAFPDFGLYIYRTADSYAGVRCGPIGLNGLGAHAHNDALSLEIVCRGRDVARDPGSYLYTPLPEERDRYRSVAAHFAPRVGDAEPGTLGPGPFRLGDEARPRCLHFDADSFLGVHYGYGAPVYRRVAFEGATLVVEDFSEGAPLRPWPPEAVKVPFSPPYGVRPA